MWRMLQQDVPDDYLIATGQTHTLEAFVHRVFAQLGLNWQDHVDTDSSLYRPSEIVHSAGDPSKAREGLGWEASVSFSGLIENLVVAERAIQKIRP